MDSKPITLELVPFDQPEAETPPADAPLALEIDIVPIGTKPSAPPSTGTEVDRFEREARRQYEEGHIDEPLWTRALAQANGDKEAAVAVYLRARATALRLLNRDLRTERRPQATAASVPVARVAADDPDPPASPRPGRLRVAAPSRAWMIGAAALVPVAGIAWFAIAQWSGGPAKEAPAAQVPSRVVAAAPAAPPAAPPQPTSEAAGPAPQGVAPDFLKKIQDLADAGNWNLFVLYAVEWTRREPANAAAWDRLRVGYVNMRQYDDAVVAAKKAAQLVPQDARMWRALGEVQMEVEDSKGALRSFEQAVALDAQDADSLKQVGVLSGRLGQAQQAKAALDAALAIHPDDANALCLRSALAQSQVQAQVKDTQVASRQAKPFDERCRSVVASSGRN